MILIFLNASRVCLFIFTEVLQLIFQEEKVLREEECFGSQYVMVSHWQEVFSTHLYKVYKKMHRYAHVHNFQFAVYVLIKETI